MFNFERKLIFSLILLFFILTVLVKAQQDFDDLQLEKQENRDITRDLTDNELKLALSDLSLKDLSTLQKFIDSVDYNYQENGFINANAKTAANNDLDAQDYENVIYPDQEDYNFEPPNNINDLIYYTKPKNNFNKFSPENPRTKRNDQETNINEEYIKQLAYSFPQNEQRDHNNNNVNELKNAHVRVKRN